LSSYRTDRRHDGEVPGAVDVDVGSVDVVMLDPLDVRLKVAEYDAAERHRTADVDRLVARRLGYDRRVWKHR